MPRYRSYVARARQAEATTNLGTINELQRSYYYEGDRGQYFSGLDYGLDKCADTATQANNELGFKLPDCSKSRYRYATDASKECAVSDGSIDQGQVYPGCNANDEWHLPRDGKLENKQDVVSKCPLGLSSSSSTCTAGSLPSAPPTYTSVTHTASTTPSPPTPPPTPKCASNVCSLVWSSTAGADDPPSKCMKCAVVGGVKKQVSCGTIYDCGWKDPYVPTPPAPPTVFVAPPSTTTSTSTTTTSTSTGGNTQPTTSTSSGGSQCIVEWEFYFRALDQTRELPHNCSREVFKVEWYKRKSCSGPCCGGTGIYRHEKTLLSETCISPPSDVGTHQDRASVYVGYNCITCGYCSSYISCP